MPPTWRLQKPSTPLSSLEIGPWRRRGLIAQGSNSSEGPVALSSRATIRPVTRPAIESTASLDDAGLAVRLRSRLPGFLRDPWRPQAVRSGLAERLAHREADFLALARTMIYDRPASPYRRLLAHAGCEYADLAHLVVAAISSVAAGLAGTCCHQPQMIATV